MILTLDVGNSQIYGGVFEEENILVRFRMNSKSSFSSDEMGIFLRSVLRENGLKPEKIRKIAICSVVPDIVHSIRNSCLKYFKIAPFFLTFDSHTGLTIKYKNPSEVGADRIANAIAASHLFPNENLIVIDLGTATTFCAISKDKEYLGGTIIAGLRLNMEALETKTAKLPSVEIRAKEFALGTSTVESIQSGLFFGHMGQMKEISSRIIQEGFAGAPVKIIGTGGFSGLFEGHHVFDVIQGDLVLKGLWLALQMK